MTENPVTGLVSVNANHPCSWVGEEVIQRGRPCCATAEVEHKLMPPTIPRGPEREQPPAHSPAPPRIELEANSLRAQSGAPLLGLSRVHTALA